LYYGTPLRSGILGASFRCQVPSASRRGDAGAARFQGWRIQRPVEEDEFPTDLLERYGGEEDIKKIEDELRGKFRQVRAVDGSNRIIPTWSDRDFV
jgi:hypothetical protein